MKKFLRKLIRCVPFVLYLVATCALSVFGSKSSSALYLSQVALPDIVFTGYYDFKYERTHPITGNDFYTLIVEVKNQGAAPAKSFRVIAQYIGPGVIGHDLYPLDKNHGYYSLKAGETVKARFQFVFQKPHNGEYNFTIKLDPSSTVNELDKSNNVLKFSRMF
jgi:subtilase family serine protease